ncbi:MAG TPA: tRNA (adenosine(37)-N6)-threonylcarbamoyltransferase complex ATPase subunit type 1 TsaE [Pirellulales bacterium]|jgi:tRNA threonylcarbamoyladenosine biosynthesis protein TsaE
MIFINNVLQFDAADEAATTAFGQALAQSLAAALPDGAVIALIGPLGAGKTRLVQAVAHAAGVEPGIVASPTFVLVHEYAGLLPIYHFDAYRLKSETEFAALGPEEYFSQRAWSFIEWADRVPNSLPPDRLEITIEPTSPTARQFNIRALGPHHEKALAVLQRGLPNNPRSSMDH